MSPKTALVIRATGAQGRGVIQHLLKSSWKVHALVTDPSTSRALALHKLGSNITLFQGSLGNPTSIATAIAGCSAVFLAQIPSLTGDDSETRDARAVLDLAIAAGIQHIVHTTQVALSVPGFGTWGDPRVAYAVAGKAAVEQLVRDSGIPWTILRPGWFGTNILPPTVRKLLPGLEEGKFISSYDPDAVMVYVDPDDIGAFAAAAFTEPQRFAGKHINVVGEKLTVKELISEIERAAGKELDVHYRTVEETEEELSRNNRFVLMETLTGAMAKFVDMDEVESWGIPLTSFREFLEKNKADVVPK